uniref:Uncharacterized protein n=1 Tax=Oryza sativa subsp. japonica TaxID=39947 RepID=Q6ZA41_ORYSJ|nr:hypothetical protein [Oryza sativa Japonica Group]
MTGFGLLVQTISSGASGHIDEGAADEEEARWSSWRRKELRGGAVVAHGTGWCACGTTSTPIWRSRSGNTTPAPLVRNELERLGLTTRMDTDIGIIIDFGFSLLPFITLLIDMESWTLSLPPPFPPRSSASSLTSACQRREEIELSCKRHVNAMQGRAQRVVQPPRHHCLSAPALRLS